VPECTIDFDREDFNDVYNNPAMQSILSSSFPPYKPFVDEAAAGGIGELGFNTINDEQSLAKTNEKDGSSALYIIVGEGLDESLYASFEEEERKQRNEVQEEGEDLYDIPSLLDEDVGVNISGELEVELQNVLYPTRIANLFFLSHQKLLQGEGLIEFEDNNETNFDKNQTLQIVSAFLCKYPEMDIHIESHLNCTPQCSGNECLKCGFSEERCQAVELFLLEHNCSNQFLSMGWGCKHPLVGSKSLIRLFP